ncbi:MAG: carbohydrate porin [Deltaproteobacteria bacterium]|nr:carbohydrate porin [Deltaproteobacteria bacterium]
MQSEKIAQFSQYIGGGVNITGEAWSRPNDVLGFGYGATFIGKDYEDYKKSSSPGFKSDTEHYMEIYYNMAINETAQYRGFHISPDIQYVINPGGANAAKVFIYGIRLQAFF